jgi:hypothetical protein
VKSNTIEFGLLRIYKGKGKLLFNFKFGKFYLGSKILVAHSKVTVAH